MLQSPLMPENATIPAALDRSRIDEIVELEAADDAPGLLRELVDTFVQTSAAELAGMRAAVDTADADALRRAAHSLKGSSASLGAVAVQRRAQEVEAWARAGRTTGCESLIGSLDEEVARAVVALRTYVESLGSTGASGAAHQ
jgi:HPt (histidine-containing phosphotransfer) domain-containing protein